MASGIVCFSQGEIRQSGRRRETLRYAGIFCTVFLRSNHTSPAQHLADEALKTGQEYAQEGVKQGRKLSEKAFEVGKDKGNDLRGRRRPAAILISSPLRLANEALNSAKKAGQFYALGIDTAFITCFQVSTLTKPHSS